MKRAIIVFAISILFLAAFYALMEEDPCAGHRGRIVTKSFYSLSVNDTYKIVIYLPEDYEKSGSRQYPVIYQLDGNYYGKLTAILAANFSCKGLIPSAAIVVGICYYYKGWGNRRVRDMTYPPPGNSSSYWAAQGAGGGLKFYNFIKDELIPYVDTHFRTDNITQGRTLIGHSLGGYFTLFALFHEYLNKERQKPTSGDSIIKPVRDRLFTNFIAASPVISYDEKYLFDLETRMVFVLSGIDSLPVNLYISMADREEKTRVEYFPMLTKQLKQWNCPGFRLKCERLPRLYHHETAVPSYKSGLKFVFNANPRHSAKLESLKYPLNY